MYDSPPPCVANSKLMNVINPATMKLHVEPHAKSTSRFYRHGKTAPPYSVLRRRPSLTVIRGSEAVHVVFINRYVLITSCCGLRTGRAARKACTQVEVRHDRRVFPSVGELEAHKTTVTNIRGRFSTSVVRLWAFAVFVHCSETSNIENIKSPTQEQRPRSDISH